MMRIVVAVWDSAMQAYANPIHVPGRGVAVRSFGDEVNRAEAQNALYAHPEDYELRVLAEFDEETGVFHDPPEGVGAVLLRGKDAIRKGDK